MGKYYSASARGFFDSEIHGARTVPSEEDPEVMVDNPACRIPADAVEITDERHLELLEAQATGKQIAPDAAGAPIAQDSPPPTQAQREAGLRALVQQHLDAQAALLGYQSIAVAVTYADEPAVPAYQAEGLALRAWRSLAWAACEKALAAKSDIDGATLIAALPTFPA